MSIAAERRPPSVASAAGPTAATVPVSTISSTNDTPATRKAGVGLGRSGGATGLKAPSYRCDPPTGTIPGVILLIDNYDSFTWNLVQRIGELLVDQGRDPGELPLKVVRNDAITADEAEALEPTHVIVSPGPCTPREAGVSGAVVERFAGRVPLLGVCLGHQTIGACFGMTVGRHRLLMHGKTSAVSHDGRTLFEGLADPMTAMRYHSLVVEPGTVDHDRFEVSAWCEDVLPGGADVPGGPPGETTRVVMGLRARPGVFGDAPLEGVQFHPESFMTPEGPAMLANFLGLPRPATPQPT